MTKTLFLVHVEEYFHSTGLISNDLIKRIKRKILWADRIFVFESELDNNYKLLGELADYLEKKGKNWKTISWGWGYEPEMYEDDSLEAQFCIPAKNSMHEFTWIPPELRNARQWDYGKICVSGGVRNECLADFLSILNYLNLKYTSPWELQF